MHVCALFRYPIKGFPAEPLESGYARAGTGFDGDRACALTTGIAPAVLGRWTGPRTLTCLKRDTTLQQWQVRTLPATTGPEAPGTGPEAPTTGPEAPTTGPEAPVAFEITAPDGAHCQFSLADPDSRHTAEQFLAGRLTAHGNHPRRLVSTDQGMFDSQSSGLSLINPATAAALEPLAGAPVDPLRFRGNIHLAGLPAFAEFGLIGSVIRIGDVQAVVRSAIQRCPATEVDPTSGSTDLPIPRLLAAGCGHLHCGIYATVIADGRIRPGDPIEVTGPAPRERIKTWTAPRFAVVEAVHTADGVAEITLRDSLDLLSELYAPGMHIRVHLPDSPDGVPTWRSYTITDVSGESLQISVRIRAGVSAWLASLSPGAQVLISGPFGQVTPDSLGEDIVILTAGIGITPALSLLPGLGGRRVRVFHSERGQPPSRQFQQLTRSAAQLTPPAELIRHRTDTTSRVTTALLLRQLSGASDVVMCGPPGFVRAATEAAQLAGLDSAAIHAEVFTSPADMLSVDLTRFAPGEDSPATVRTASGTVFDWTPEQGMLLDALERAGVAVESLCRAGACGRCAVSLRAGRVAYPVEPSAPREQDEILCCSAVPQGPIELDV